jgi:hypothetical protein
MPNGLFRPNQAFIFSSVSKKTHIKKFKRIQTLRKDISKRTACPSEWFVLKKCPFELRIVSIRDPETKAPLAFITNNMKFAALTIAALCYFQGIQRNLRI